MANGNRPQATPLTATPFDPDDRPSIPEDLLRQGHAIQKAGTPFMTAISVQKPRNLDLIVKGIEKEAEYAGEKFWYRLPFGNSKVEGPTIGLATSLLREWGNCAVTMAVDENDDAFIFTPRYIDLEKGVQLERAFHQRKNQTTGKMDSDRAIDIAFQIGQSKAIRNVIINALPKWLVARAIQRAKATVASGITPESLENAKKIAIAFFDSLGVTLAQLVDYIEAPAAEWTSENLADLRAAREALTAKETTVAELFPAASAAVPAGPLKASAVQKPVEVASEPAPPATGAPAPDEAERIRGRELYEAMPIKCEKCKLWGGDTQAQFVKHEKEKHGAKPAGKF